MTEGQPDECRAAPASSSLQLYEAACLTAHLHHFLNLEARASWLADLSANVRYAPTTRCGTWDFVHLYPLMPTALQMTEPACRVYGNRRMVHCFVLQETNLQKHEAALSPFLPVPESNERPNQYDHLLAAPGKASDESDQIAKAVPPFRLRSARAESTTSGSDKLQQTFPSWEPCARSIDSERKDFWEFIVDCDRYS